MFEQIKPFLVTAAVVAATVFVIFRLLPVGVRKFLVGA
jgi:hypothetical protein